MFRFVAERIQVKLILVIALALLIPTTLIGVYSISATTNDLLRTAAEKNLQLVSSRSAALLQLLAEGERDTLQLSQAPATRQYVGTLAGSGDNSTKKVLISQLRLFLTDTPNYLSVHILSHTGRELLGVEKAGGITSVIPEDSLQDQQGQLYFIEAIRLTGHVYISSADLDINYRKSGYPYPPISRLPVIRFSLPLYTDDGGLAGILVLKLSLQAILSAKPDSNGTIYIIDENGNYLAHPDPAKRFGSLLKTGITFSTDQPQNAALINDTTRGTTFSVPNREGVLQAVASVAIPHRDSAYWTFIYEEQLSNIFREINNARLINVVLASGSLLAALSLAWIITRNIVQPVRQLAALSVSISRGQWDVQIPVVKNQDEIGALANAFDHMSKELKALYTDLEARVISRTSELETVAKVSAAAAASLDLDKLLQTVADLTGTHFNLSHVYVYLLDKTGSDLILATDPTRQNGIIAGANRSIALDHPKSGVAQAARTRQGIVVNDIRSREMFLSVLLHPNTHSEMCIPLVSGGRVLGVLDLQSDRVNRFTEADLRVMSILGDQIAVAVQNAYSYKEQKETAEQLAIAQHRAEDASKAKSIFLSNMSHELRTPLNVIIGYTTSMLERPAMYQHLPLPEIYLKDIKLINESGYHLIGLINDILDLGKIEAGRLELQLAPTNLIDILRGVVATSIGLIKDKPIQIKPDFPDSLPLVWADATRVRQIVLNLMSNAIKFTEHGSITLRAMQIDQAIRIAVIDTGIGIPEKALATIFDRFQQADKNISRRYGGTGLGLDISKQLCQMHGGDLTVTSVVGQGSAFTFTLPVAQSSTPIPTPAAVMGTTQVFSGLAPVATPFTVMLVEDEANLSDLLRRSLQSAGYMVTATNNSPEAIEMALGLLPDMIVFDLPSSRTDGWQLLEALRTNPEISPIPLLVCVEPQQKERAVQLGIWATLDKPIVPEQIVQAVQGVQQNNLFAKGE